jgi:hypothetical protein
LTGASRLSTMVFRSKLFWLRGMGSKSCAFGFQK